MSEPIVCFPGAVRACLPFLAEARRPSSAPPCRLLIATMAQHSQEAREKPLSDLEAGTYQDDVGSKPPDPDFEASGSLGPDLDCSHRDLESQPPADVFADIEAEHARYDAREQELMAQYRGEEHRRKERQQAEYRLRGIIPPDCVDPDSDDDEYCYNEIKNLVLIETSLVHRKALAEWERKEKLFTSRVERKTKKAGNLKNEVYQLIGFFSVFQGVVLTAVAQSNLLHCNNRWSPIILSVLASVVTVAGVTQKLLQVSSLQETIFTEERALKDAVHRGAALRKAGKDFVFVKLGKAKRKEPKKENFRWYTVSVLSFLFLFTLAFPLSHWRILCNPGPNPYNQSPGT